MTPAVLRAGAASVLIAVLGTLGVLVMPGRAAAAQPDASGYWWRVQPAGASIVGAPHVPDEGLWVAADPAGDHAIAALRVTAPARAMVDSIVLDVADTTGTVAVAACPASSAWEPAAAGPWDARPSAACERFAIEGVVSEDGSTVTFDLRAVGISLVDVVIAPVPGAAAFSATFEPPGDQTVSFAPRPAPQAPAATVAEAQSSPSAEPSAATFPSAAPTSFDLPATGTATAVYAPPVAGFASSVYEDAPAPGIEPSARATASSAMVPPPDLGRRHPAVIAVALGVVAAWFWRTRAAVRAAAEHPLARGWAGTTTEAGG